MLLKALRRRVAALGKRMDETTELLKTLTTKKDLEAFAIKEMVDGQITPPHEVELPPMEEVDGHSLNQMGL